MHGAAALAQALGDADVRLVVHVPGFGATQAAAALETTARPSRMFYHEEVALLAAHGASLVGTRAALLTKTHGALKAANALADALVCGTTAALVCFVFDDPECAHSDSVLEGAPLLEALRVPYRRADAASIAADVGWAVAESERLRLPVALVVDAREMTRPAQAASFALPSAPAYARDVHAHVACPFLATHQRAVGDAKLAGADWRALPRPTLPVVPDGFPASARATLDAYAPIFDAFRAVRGPFVAGDAGLPSAFAFPPYDAVDAVSCMGGSIPLALGAALAGVPAWAVCGDFSFAAAAHLGLHDAARAGVPLKVLLLDNGVASATGGQRVHADALEMALGTHAKRARWTTPAGVPAALAEAASEPGLSIVVALTR